MGIRLAALGVAGFEAVVFGVAAAIAGLVAGIAFLGVMVCFELLQAILFSLVTASGFQVAQELGVVVRGGGLSA